jgi:MFS transporter, SP family, general alpha glucoside:H+ symporter
MAEGGYRERHHSVANYEANTNLGSFSANTGAGFNQGGRRRSSVAFAGSVSGAAQQKENVLNMQDDTLRKMSIAVPNLAELSADAKAGAESERKMGFREGARLYPKAMFFSFGLSLAVVMEGYDTWLLGNFFGMSAFAKKYGGPAGIVNGVQTYQISATWQTALTNSTAAAQILGLFFNGIISERVGYRKTMMGALFAITCFIFINFFAINIHMLLAGYILSGLPWCVMNSKGVSSYIYQD